MKTQLPAMVVFLFGPTHWRTPLVSAALCLRPQKNQPSLAGFLYLRLTVFDLTALLLPPASLSCRRRSFQSTIQTPSSL